VRVGFVDDEFDLPALVIQTDQIARARHAGQAGSSPGAGPHHSRAVRDRGACTR
jgi:hypothetical protein